jgi:hypothetical protein
MDGLIKLPFQGATENGSYSTPRRCHWAELTYGFQPLKKQFVQLNSEE